VPILAAVALLLCGQPAFAVRLARFTVAIDDKVVLEASTSDTGGDADTIWRSLKGLELQPVKGYKVEAGSDDPLRATLKGKVTIQEVYGGRAEVSELKLVRAKDDAPWTIVPAEVERTLKSRHKPVRFSVSIDGKVALWTDLQTSPGDTAEDADTAWGYLKGLGLRPENRYKVEAESDDPLRATLRGTVIIQEYYGGQGGSRAEVSELKLVREKDNARWRVAPGEVERTFKSRNKPK
jgi:hypothetical protein